MPVTISPSNAPDRELDITGALVAAVAAELWRNFGGNDVLNWMEAERFVQSLMVKAPPPVPPSAAIESRPRHRTARPPEPARFAGRRSADDRVTGPLPVL
jgi:hypothetical protein